MNGDCKYKFKVMDMLSIFGKDANYREIGPALVVKQKQGRKINMCEVAQSLIERGIAKGVEQGIAQGVKKGVSVGESKARVNMLADYLSNGGNETDAKRMLKATEDEIKLAKMKLYDE